jgi:hypothetical protein
MFGELIGISCGFDREDGTSVCSVLKGRGSSPVYVGAGAVTVGTGSVTACTGVVNAKTRAIQAGTSTVGVVTRA